MTKVKSKRSLESFITELESIKEDLIGRSPIIDKSNYFKDEDLIVKINDAFSLEKKLLPKTLQTSLVKILT